MKRKKHNPEQIVALLRDTEADVAAGLKISPVADH